GPGRCDHLARTGRAIQRGSAYPETWRRLAPRRHRTLHQAMTVFSDLVRSPLPQSSPDGSLEQWQEGVDALFPSAVSRSPFRLWSPGDPIPATGDRLLIGVATWSAHDLGLLDAVSQALQTRPPGLAVDLFNVADCATPQAFERYVPGIGNVFH